MMRIWREIPTIETEVAELLKQEADLEKIKDRSSDAFKVS